MTLQAAREQIDGLRRKGKLDKHLVKLDVEALPWPEWLAVMAGLSIVLVVVPILSLVNATKALPPGGELDEKFRSERLGMFVLLALLFVLFGGLARLLKPRVERLRDRLVKRGVVVPAAVLQANSAWREDDSRWWPGTVVLSFDPKAQAEPERLRRLAAELAATKDLDRTALPHEIGAVAWDLYHEMVPLPARRLPPQLAGGLDGVYVATVDLPPQPVEAQDLLAVLALPGQTDAGGFAVVSTAPAVSAR